MLQNTCEQLRQELESIKNLKKNFDVSLQRAEKFVDIEGLKGEKKVLEEKINEAEELLVIHLFPKSKKEYQAQENPLRWGEFNFGDKNKNRVEEIKKLKTHLNTKTLEKKILFQIILGLVQARFEAHIDRHPKIIWENVEKKLKANPEKMLSLCLMELTGGEPDIVDYDRETDKYIFDDCSAESPEGRRNIVYDQAGEKEQNSQYPTKKCNGNAIDMALAMGIEMHDKTYYRNHQMKNPCDRKTFSWVKTPDGKRNPVDKNKAGVALGGYRSGSDIIVYERRPYDRSGPGGFRGSLRV